MSLMASKSTIRRLLGYGFVCASVLAVSTAWLGGAIMLQLVSGETPWTVQAVAVMLIFTIVTLGFLRLARRFFRQMVSHFARLEG